MPGGRPMLNILRMNLASHTPQKADAKGRQASVAAVVCGEDGLDLLFIHRTAHEGDPWSGHLAFPGGRTEPGDTGLKMTAERETREELGLDLTEARCLGQLDDLMGVTIPVCVSAFVYELDAKPLLDPNDEVDDAFWFPLEDLADSGRRVTGTFLVDGCEREYPGIDFRLESKPILWGLTFRFCQQMVALAGISGDGEDRNSD